MSPGEKAGLRRAGCPSNFGSYEFLAPPTDIGHEGVSLEGHSWCASSSYACGSSGLSTLARLSSSISVNQPARPVSLSREYPEGGGAAEADGDRKGQGSRDPHLGSHGAAGKPLAAETLVRGRLSFVGGKFL